MTVSGIYELRLILKINVNEEIRIRSEDVSPLSPIQFAPARLTQYEVLVGEAEPVGWKEQSEQFATHLKQHSVNVTMETLPRRNHYTILQDLETPTSLLANRISNDIKGKPTSNPYEAA